jgi:hypothetical protein
VYRELKEIQEIRVQRDLMVQMVQRAHKDLKVKLAHKVQRVHGDLKEIQEIRVLQELLEHKELQA